MIMTALELRVGLQPVILVCRKFLDREQI